jgi:sec-independent protein translocase protein TatB
MFDIGFSEVLLIFVIALIVLGPEKLPRAASQVGRWIGRARAMARQFKEQLEEEVNLENVRKAHKDAAAKEDATSKDTASGGEAAAGTPGAGSNPSLDPADFRADTFSHAHPTNEYGANPLTPDGAPPEESKPWPAAEAPAEPAPAASDSETSGSSAGSVPFPRDPQSAPADAANRSDGTAAPTSPAPPAYTPAANEPIHEPAPVSSVQSDNHGHS